MKPSSSPPRSANDSERIPHESDLHHLVDGRLSAMDLAWLETELAADTDARETVTQWQAQRARLRELHNDTLGEPIPATLYTAAVNAASSHERNNRVWHGSAIAAGLVCALIAGWYTQSWLPPASGSALLAQTPSPDQTQRFLRQAAVAHTLYQPERRHPVEVGADQETHLLQWLSRRLDHPLRVPDLNALGYRLVGGRLLPGDGSARAQFMFEDQDGERITLYVGALDKSAQSQAAANETAFRFTEDGKVSLFYWVDRGFGYSLSGQLPRARLLALAEASYQQLYAQ